MTQTRAESNARKLSYYHRVAKNDPKQIARRKAYDKEYRKDRNSLKAKTRRKKAPSIYTTAPPHVNDCNKIMEIIEGRS